MLCRYAGAGLFDSIQTQEPVQRMFDLTSDPLWVDQSFQLRILRKIARACIAVEQVTGSSQDIEGALDASLNVHILQSRPQV